MTIQEARIALKYVQDEYNGGRDTIDLIDDDKFDVILRQDIGRGVARDVFLTPTATNLSDATKDRLDFRDDEIKGLGGEVINLFIALHQKGETFWVTITYLVKAPKIDNKP